MIGHQQPYIQEKKGMRLQERLSNIAAMVIATMAFGGVYWLLRECDDRLALAEANSFRSGK